MRFLARVIGVIGLCCASSLLWAQQACTLPSHLPSPKLVKADCVNPIKPDGLVLALSWSPQHCASRKTDDPQDIQCGLNHFGFVVHGLWPQQATARNKCDHPRNCGSSLVDQDSIQKTLCTMPNVTLIQSEWQKHGTCSGLTAPEYFGKVRSLFQTLVKPDITRLLDGDGFVSAGAISDAFVRANQAIKLPSEALAVRVASKNEFQEILVCYDLNYRFTACTSGRTPDKQRIHVITPSK